MKNSNVIYSITVEDLQSVAKDIIDRDLTTQELNLVSKELIEGSYIDWYSPVELAIREIVGFDGPDDYIVDDVYAEGIEDEFDEDFDER